MMTRTTRVITALSLVAACAADEGDARDEGGNTGGIASLTSSPTGDVTGETTTDASEGSSPSTTATGPDPDDSDDGIKFDLETQPDLAAGCGGGGGGGGGAADFSYIWIANSNESTVSKINTESLIEEGRYITRPDGNGNPSRTSVNLNGDMAIGNRSGGLTMIFARHDQCPDATNTSSGPADVKAWPDGCVGWHTPMAYASQRPVAWTAGTFNESTCRYDDAKVWTSGANDPAIDVLLVDGETGTIEQTIPLPGNVVASFFGIYGAAVDSTDNFWGSQLSIGHIVRIDRVTSAVETWPMPVSGYGMAVDRNDRVWTCSSQVGRFDYPSQTWQTASVGGSTGCMPDGANILWMANDPIVGVDIDTLLVAQTLDVPDAPRGISIDFNGYVWGPSLGSNAAYRVDPATGTVDTVTGLNYPYTYSDMTGFGLSQVGAPSG
ncbi:MAG: hypothetical protein IAG13_08295 [Deltaproteobacteria bacterium]|nr:hypothetical protein [Nannocystaceae bacterium]